MISNFTKLKKDSRGFTIVELLVVIVVIAILAAITIVSYNGITARAKDAQALSNANSVQSVIEVMNAENGNYPVTLASLNTGTTTSKVPAGVTVEVGTAAKPETATTSADGQTTVAVSLTGGTTTATVTGGRISYYSVQDAVPRYVYFGAASSTSTFLALPAS